VENSGVEIDLIAASKRCLSYLKGGSFSVYFIFLAEFWLSFHKLNIQKINTEKNLKLQFQY